jgi:hypothetical protein
MLSFIFFLDLTLVFFSFYILKKTYFHILNPFFYFLIYHVVFVSIRIFSWLCLKDSPLNYLPINVEYSEVELIKAFILEIFSLSIFLIVYVLLSQLFNKNKSVKYNIRSINLGIKLMAFITGYLFVLFSNIFGFQFFSFDSENSIIGSLINSIQNWFILVLVLIYFVNNEKSKFLLYVIFSAIIIQAFQGFGRWRLMVDLLFFASLFWVKKGIKFPKISILKGFVIVICILIFSQLKYIGLLFFALDSNLNLPSLSEFLSFSDSKPIIFNLGDLYIIDHQAALIKAIDVSSFKFGNTYLTNFEIFLPKYLFPNKNPVNYWLQEIPLNSQLFKINGGIPTLVGESYANFGFLGPLFVITPIAILSIYSFMRLRFSISRRIISYDLIFYLSFYLSFFQILRDGFSYVFNFIIFAFFPLLFFKYINIKILNKKFETT